MAVGKRIRYYLHFRAAGLGCRQLLLPAMLMFLRLRTAASFLQNLPSFVLERVRPQSSRVSPIKGFGRIFSVPGLVEFGKALFKVLIVSICMVFVMRGDFMHALDAMFADPRVGALDDYGSISKMMVVILLATAALSAADFFLDAPPLV